MKTRLLICLIGSLSATALSAQLFTIGPDSVTVTGSADDLFIEVHTTLVNTQDTAINVAWKRQVISQPEEWINYLCSDFLCFLPEHDSGNIYVLPHQEMDVNMTFFPQNVAGLGEVVVTFWDTTDQANTTIPIRYACIAENTTAAQHAVHPSFRLYPNPVSSWLLIESDREISRLRITSLSGLVLQQHIGVSRIPVARLPAGSYLVQLVFADGTVVARPFIRI